MRFLGPDELKGLYSDPEQHAKQPAFLLDLHEGSTTTHDFALVVGDKKGVKPSRHAVQTLVLRPRGGRLEGDGVSSVDLHVCLRDQNLWFPQRISSR